MSLAEVQAQPFSGLAVGVDEDVGVAFLRWCQWSLPVLCKSFPRTWPWRRSLLPLFAGQAPGLSIGPLRDKVATAARICAGLPSELLVPLHIIVQYDAGLRTDMP